MHVAGISFRGGRREWCHWLLRSQCGPIRVAYRLNYACSSESWELELTLRHGQEAG
jgi:hypothetical protein